MKFGSHFTAKPLQTALSLALCSAAGLTLPRVALAQNALAQNRPDAGSILLQNQPPSLPERGAPVQPSVAPLPQLAAPAQQNAQVDVKGFRFEGNTLLPAAELEKVVAPYVRLASFDDLQRAAIAVATAYRDQGWVVRTLLPQQDITQGIILIQVIEARLGNLRIEGQDPLRSPGGSESVLLDPQPKGALLNTRNLERGLLILNDAPGINASGSLAEGGEPGQADVLVKLTSTPLLTGEVALDNNGARSTGEQRVQLTGSVNNGLGLGDQLSAQLVKTQGSTFVRSGWTMLASPGGLRLGVNASHMSYRLVSPEFKTTEGKGSSQTLGLEASYPIERTPLSAMNLTASLAHRRFSNEAGAATTSRYRTNSATVGLSGYVFDSASGGGVSSGLVALTVGRNDLGGSPNEAGDAATARTAGGYAKLRVAATRQQPITPDLSASFGVSGQLANKNLDSSERFYVGGPDTLPAYPVSEGGGSDAILLNVGMRYRLPGGWSVGGQVDTGRIRQYHKADFTGAPARNILNYSGLGASVDWKSESGWTLSLALARRLGTNPNANPTTGTDQDGTLKKSRYWFGARKTF